MGIDIRPAVRLYNLDDLRHLYNRLAHNPDIHVLLTNGPDQEDGYECVAYCLTDTSTIWYILTKERVAYEYHD